MIGRPPVSHSPLRQISQICCPRDHRASAAVAAVRPPSFRSIIFRPSICTKRPFSSTKLRYDANFKNHYEIMRMSPTATKAELKKQFYALSKETHPDRHPDDPTASERFSQVSESYSILADDEKRRRYDRDFHRIMGGGGRGGRGPNGTPQSGTYAGSRPPSGLSKRRGTFRGPPPSFYAQGGYGNSTNSASSSQSQPHQGASAGGGRPDGGDPYMAGTFNSQSYSERMNTDYNPEPTYRTQTVEDQRRMQRRAAEFRASQSELDNLSDSDFWARFVIVTTIVGLGVVVGSLIVNMSNTPRGGFTRSDGSKRGGDKRNDWAKG